MEDILREISEGAKVTFDNEVIKATKKIGIDIDEEAFLKAFRAAAFVDELIEYIFMYLGENEDYVPCEIVCRKLYKYGLIDKDNGFWTPTEERSEP